MTKFDVIVTRHAGLVDYLKEEKIITGKEEIINHVTDVSQLQGKNVIGVLPLSLAQHCASVTEIPMDRIPVEMRGKELSASDMRKYVGEPITYVVTVAGDKCGFCGKQKPADAWYCPNCGST